MEELEISAKTVEKALQNALGQLGVNQEEVEVTVLSEGKPGILGMGAQEARIRVRPLMPKPKDKRVELSKTVLETLLKMMGISASIVPHTQPFVESSEDIIAPPTFDIQCDDSGVLIGRGGHTLSCLQYIVNLMVAHQVKAWLPVTIDVDGYKQRHHKGLQSLALRMAEQVRISGEPFTLEPMTAYDRRIIHLTLAEYPDIVTESTGEGESRKVVILPQG